MKNNGSKWIWTFEWHSLRRDLLRNVWVVLLTGWIAFMGIYIAEHSAYAPTYTGSAILSVRVKGGTSGMIDNLAASADTAGIYAEVFQGENMKALAAKNLGMDTFPGEITASVASGINLMKISVTADHPELAYRLLTSVLEVYPQISDALFSNAVMDIMEAPQMPTSPSKRISSSLGVAVILLAMMVQTCFIVLLSGLRKTVKHEQAFNRMIDGKLLGTVAHESSRLPLAGHLGSKRRALLICSAYCGFQFSEDFQKLATRLEHLKRDCGASVFAITGVAENEGKSTVTVNLALALSERGYRVAVIDLDLRKPSLYKLMEVPAEPNCEFGDVLLGKMSVRDYRFREYRCGIRVALNRHCYEDASDWIGTDHTKEILAEISADVDFVLMDTSPISVSADAATLARIADQAILVVRTDCSAAADVNDAIETLSGVGGNLAGCVLNDVYRPFTFWGQMGADESGGYDSSHLFGKRYDKYRTMDDFDSLHEFEVTSAEGETDGVRE